MSYPIKVGQTAQVLEFLMVLSADHISPATGLSPLPTVVLSKNGAAFITPGGTVMEVGNGWYVVSGNATDASILGPLVLHATATGCDPTDVCFPVVAYDPLNGVSLGLSELDVIASKTNLITSLTVANATSTTGPIISALAPFATSADMLLRYDGNLLCQVVSDLGTRVTTFAALATNAVMTEALMASSGTLEAACLKGGMYQPSDLTALVATNSGSYLRDIVCGLAMSWIGERRVNKEPLANHLFDKAMGALAMLADGDRIFGLQAQAQAGITSHDIELSTDVETRDDIVVQAERLYGKRSNRTSTFG